MIDWPFITSQESYSLKGYWPQGQLASGVTLAGGVDLGQLGSDEFKELPLTLQQKLKPYIGLKGYTAQHALNGAPLTLTQEEADALELPKRARMEADLRKHFERDSGASFDAPPDAVQTVLMSVSWQYGPIWKRCPKFWASACRKDWRGMISELENFGDDFPSRRKREANYLKANLPDEVVVVEAKKEAAA